MAATSLSRADLLREVESRYALGIIESLIQWESLSSLVYRVKTGAGANFLLKRHECGKKLEDLLGEEEILSTLNSSAFTLAPRLISTRDNQFHFDYQGHLWSLLEFRESDVYFDWTRPSWSPGHCEAAGAALAIFHSQAKTCLGNLSTGEFPLRLLFTRLDSSIRQAISHLAKSVVRAEFIDFVWQNKQVICDSLERTRQDVLQESKDLRLVYVHGDYHPGNLLYQGLQVTTIIDFEHVHQNNAGYDLGYAALFFASCWQPDNQDGAIDRHLLNCLMAGYRRQLELFSPQAARQELSLQPFMRLASHLLISWALDKLCTGDSKLAGYYICALRHGYKALALLDSQGERYTYAIPGLVN